jgi:hypothetical protein
MFYDLSQKFADMHSQALDRLNTLIQESFDKDAFLEEVSDNTHYLRGTIYAAGSRRWFNKEAVEELRTFDNIAFLRALTRFLTKQGIPAKIYRDINLLDGVGILVGKVDNVEQ